MIGTWRHRRTGKTYVVVKLLRGKMLRIGFSQRVWIDCLEYTSVESGGQSFVRELPDFLASFEPLSIRGDGASAEGEAERTGEFPVADPFSEPTDEAPNGPNGPNGTDGRGFSISIEGDWNDD